MYSVNWSILDQLQVTDNDDRVAILQTITAMRADLMTNSNDSNSIIKIPLPNSANSSRSRHLSASNMQSSESSRNSTPSGDHTIPSHGRHRHCSLTTELKVWEHRRLLSKSLDRLTEVCRYTIIVCYYALTVPYSQMNRRRRAVRQVLNNSVAPVAVGWWIFYEKKMLRLKKI